MSDIIPGTLDISKKNPEQLSEKLKDLNNKKENLKEDIEFFQNIQNLGLNEKQQQDLYYYYKTLSKKDKKRLDGIVTKSPQELKSLLDIFDDKNLEKINKNLEQRISKLKEKYKNNSELLDKIDELHTTIKTDLRVFLGPNGEYSNILKGILQSKNPGEDISQKIKTLELIKKEIGNLDIALKIIESSKEKQKRYEGLYKEYKKIKQLKDFEDIIGNKDFDKLTAGDFYAMLKTAPDKVRGLLLSTLDGKNVGNISQNWEDYKNKVLKVNFGKNKGLDKIVGAGDILDITKVKKVKINGVEGIRKANPRPGYYDAKGHYLAIHDGYRIEIIDTTPLTGEKELKEFNEAKNKRFEEIRGTEIRRNLSNIIQEEINKNPNQKEIQIPYKSKVDQEYIENFINKKENKYLDLKVKNGKIKVGEKFNIWHLKEALNSYGDTKKNIISYLEKHKEFSNSKVVEINFTEIGLENSQGNKEFLESALKTIIGNDNIKITINSSSFVIDSSDINKNIGEIFSTDYEYRGNKHRHEKYMSEIISASGKYGVPKGLIIQLIYHENASWNPRLKAPGSSAYGLGQMVDSTWSRFGKGDRNNPADQLMATAKYLNYIKSRKKCSWEETLAYYNTGLGIMRVKNINRYYNLNPAIANKQPSGEPRTNRNYFIAAVAYYNDINFEQAKAKVKSV